jgi:hypothetical protein
MTLYEAFLPEVMPWARACAEPVAVQAIRNAAIEFCDTSGWWRYETDVIPLVPNQADYDIPTPDETDVSTLLSAFYNERQLFIRTPDQLGGDVFMDWRSIGANQPSVVTQMSQSQVRLSPYPNVDLVDNPGLTLMLALKPTRDSEGVWKPVYDNYAEAIAHGALARLYSQMETPYSNPDAMIMARRMFNAGVDDARAEVNRAYGRVPITVQIPRFL